MHLILATDDTGEPRSWRFVALRLDSQDVFPED